MNELNSNQRLIYLQGLVGSGGSNRVGDSIRTQSLEFHVLATRNGTDGNVRVVIYRDSENQGATPSTGDLLQSTGTLVNMTSPINWVNHNPNGERNRFVILLDEVMSVSSSEPNVHHRVKLTQGVMKHARFRGTSSAMASSAEGALFIMVITDQAANQPLISWYSRIVFTDD